MTSTSHEPTGTQPSRQTTTNTVKGTSRTPSSPSAPRPNPNGHHSGEMIACWILLAAMVVVNILHYFGILMDTASASDAQTLSWFMPDSYVQLIWVPIYLMLILWVIRLGNSRRRMLKSGTMPISLLGLLFMATAVVQIGWVLAWSFGQYWLAVAASVVDTVLIFVLGFYSKKHDHSIWGWMPFSLFGTWMLVSTIISFMRALFYHMTVAGSISPTAQGVCTVIIEVLLLAVAFVMHHRLHDWLFGIVALWAIAGVAFHIMDLSKFTGFLVIIIATLGALLIYVPWHRITGHLEHLDNVGAARK